MTPKFGQPTTITMTITPPEDLRDKSPEDFLRWLNAGREEFLANVAVFLASTWTSKQAQAGTVSEAQQQGEIESAIAHSGQFISHRGRVIQ